MQLEGTSARRDPAWSRPRCGRYTMGAHSDQDPRRGGKRCAQVDTDRVSGCTSPVLRGPLTCRSKFASSSTRFGTIRSHGRWSAGEKERLLHDGAAGHDQQATASLPIRPAAAYILVGKSSQDTPSSSRPCSESLLPGVEDSTTTMSDRGRCGLRAVALASPVSFASNGDWGCNARFNYCTIS